MKNLKKKTVKSGKTVIFFFNCPAFWEGKQTNWDKSTVCPHPLPCCP